MVVTVTVRGNDPRSIHSFPTPHASKPSHEPEAPQLCCTANAAAQRISGASRQKCKGLGCKGRSLWRKGDSSKGPCTEMDNASAPSL